MSAYPDGAFESMRAAERMKTPSTRPEDLRAASARIAADLEAFQARGGKVQRLPAGTWSRPLQSLKEINDASWHVRMDKQA